MNSFNLGSEEKMGECTLHFKLIHGRISDDIFDKEHVCIVNSNNSIGCKNFGITRDIVQKYPYADIAGLRFPQPGWGSIAALEDRSPEGNVYINQPPIYRQGSATVATIITQYGIGACVEENMYAKEIIERSGDMLYTSRLKCDTLQNRIIYFDKSLFNLSTQLKKPEFDHIKQVIIPAGIGRRGKMDNIWLRRYFPIISSFAEDIHTAGKLCILLTSDDYLKFTEKRIRKSSFSNSNNLNNIINKLKDLTIIRDDEINNVQNEKMYVNN